MNYIPPSKFAVPTRPTVDARALGCACDVCPLSARKPIQPPVIPPNTELLVVNDCPSDDADAAGRLVADRLSRIQDRVLDRAGIHNVPSTVAVLCRPKEKMSKGEWKHAAAACKPRLDRELANASTILALGETALLATTGKTNLTNWAGSPIGKVIASFSPSFVSAQGGRAYMPVLMTHAQRAVQLSQGLLPKWEWPTIHVEPDEAMLEALRNLEDGPIGVDVETENVGTDSPLHCIGLADTKVSISVPYPFPDEDFAWEVCSILASNRPKVWQNGQFDRAVFRHNGIVVNGPHEDTLLLHAIVAPQIKHGLGFMAGIEFHAEAWKAEHKGGADEKGIAKFRDDAETRTYNAKDAYMQRVLYSALSSRLDTTHQGQSLYAEAKALDEVSEWMGRWGVYRYDHRVNRLREVLVGRIQQASVKLNEALAKLNIPPVNFNSTLQLRTLFFQTFKCQPTHWTDGGDPSTDEEALTAIVTGDNQVASAIARELLVLREKSKLLSTYIDGLEVGPDNRYHFRWKPWGTVTGRWSSSPNAQNVPKKLRGMFRASPGNYLVEADYSQLELRIIALQAGAEKLLSWYADGQDVHTLNARQIFQTETPTKGQRNLAKGFAYAANYKATARTIWRVLVLQFPDLKLALVEWLLKQWFTLHPEIADWQDKVIGLAEKDMYVEEPLSGRRRHFYGPPKPTEVCNFPIQAMAGTLTNRAIKGIFDALNPDEKILFQVHDAIVLEGPDPERLKCLLSAYMVQSVTLDGRTATFPIDAHSGEIWNF